MGILLYTDYLFLICSVFLLGGGPWLFSVAPLLVASTKCFSEHLFCISCISCANISIVEIPEGEISGPKGFAIVIFGFKLRYYRCYQVDTFPSPPLQKKFLSQQQWTWEVSLTLSRMRFVPLLCVYKKQAPESPQDLKRAQREEEFPEPTLRGAGVALTSEESINEDMTVAGVHQSSPPCLPGFSVNAPLRF